MRRFLTDLPPNLITRLLNTRDVYNGTPLCFAAAQENTNTDVVLEMVRFIIQQVDQPGVSFKQDQIFPI